MSHFDDARERYLGWTRAAAPGDEPAWMRTLRKDAAKSFAEQGLPHRKLEEWRYTNLASLAKVSHELPEGRDPALSRAAVEKLSFPVFACSLYVFVDGHFAPDVSTTRALSGESSVSTLAELRAGGAEKLEPYLGRLADPKLHAFAALNTALLDDGAAVFVKDGVTIEQPIHLVFVSTDRGRPTARHPRVLVVAGERSRFSVIQDHVSLGGEAGFSNSVTEVFVGRDAHADLVLLQREGGDDFHVSNLAVRQERDSRFAAHTITLGGRLVRNDANVLLADEGADCTLNGLFVGRDERVIDNHTMVDHAMPHGTSRELYKGVLGGRSRGVFRGRVIVRPDAQHTNAEQSNPNLLLEDGAEIDTKPQLEIYADDVKCSHGSTIGQIDEDALFYLRSRGISEPLARDLLTRAFASEILDALPIPPLAEELSDELLAALHRGEESQ